MFKPSALNGLSQLIFCGAFVLFVASPQAAGQNPDPEKVQAESVRPLKPAVADGQTRIESIIIRGNVRIPADTIRKSISINPGDVYDPVKIERDVTTLKEQGDFDEVRQVTSTAPAGTKGGTVVIFYVHEKKDAATEPEPMPTDLTGLGTRVQTQETRVLLLQNQQLKVEMTKHLESCAAFHAGEGNLNAAAAAICTEISITNNSGAPITAWLATAEWESPAAPGKTSGVSVHAGDSVIFADDRLYNAEILPHDTHRVQMGNPAHVDFKAAVFQDGSVFGATECVDRIVQNRRRVYQDVAESLKTLRAARQAGETREQIFMHLQEMDQKEREQEQANLRALPLEDRLMLPRPSVYGLIARSLGSYQMDAATLGDDLDRSESMLLNIANRLLASQPRLSNHPVPLGEPLETSAGFGNNGN
jgi:hypothetical protein